MSWALYGQPSTLTYTLGLSLQNSLHDFTVHTILSVKGSEGFKYITGALAILGLFDFL